MIAILGIQVASVSTENGEGPWHSFTQGMAFVWSKPVIISLLLVDVGATTLGSYRALLPIFAEALGVGAAGFGILSAAPGIGSVLGAGAMLSLGDMRYKGLYTVFGVLFYSGALVILALAPSFNVAIIAAGLLGMANTVQVIPRNSVILGISPAQLRGRVEAFRSMVAGGAPSLGYTLSGGIAALLGAPLAVLIGAISCGLLVIMIGVSHAALRDKNLGEPPVIVS
jgi:MFS family permease